MSAPLTRGQKIYLSNQAQAAFLLAQARGEPIPDCGCGAKPAESYRHNQVIAACGRHGLCCCTQDHYADVKARFLDLLGHPARAFNAAVKGATNNQRVWQWKIIRRCEQFGVRLATADGICRRMTHGLSLDDADERALKNVFFKLLYYKPKPQYQAA